MLTLITKDVNLSDKTYAMTSTLSCGMSLVYTFFFVTAVSEFRSYLLICCFCLKDFVPPSAFSLNTFVYIYILHD